MCSFRVNKPTKIHNRKDGLCSLKIRVAVVRLIQIGWGRSSPFGQLRCPDSLRESVRPWSPIQYVPTVTIERVNIRLAKKLDTQSARRQHI